MILVYHFDFELTLGNSNALRRISIGWTLPFVVACALSVERESDYFSLSRTLDGSDVALS
jgi:hypothetical protein